MGRYSRKDMITFANYAKSYQSSRDVSKAYIGFLKGERVVNHNSIYNKFRRANVVYVDGLTVKDRNKKEDIPYFLITKDFSMYVIDSWDDVILKLKTRKRKL